MNPDMMKIIQALVGDEEMARMQQMQGMQGGGNQPAMDPMQPMNASMGDQHNAMGSPGIGDPQIDQLAELIQRQRNTATQQMQGPIDPYYLDQRRQMAPQQGLDERMPQPRPRMPRFEGYR